MNLRIRLLVSLSGGILGGTGLAFLFPVGTFGINFLAPAFLLSASIYVLLSVWGWAGGGRLLAWMIALAFFTRLVCGISLSLALPAFGSNSETQKAGFVFFDAFRRDAQAWTLSVSDVSILKSFQNEFYTDQYGGLLALSALVYRYLSPDAHRSFLILILAAFAAALGVPFFWQAIRQRWGEPVAKIAGWILVLYPESVLLGGSQMREPFLISFGAIAFWAVLNWQRSRRISLWVFASSILGLALFSTRVAVVVFGVMAVWFWLEYGISTWKQSRRVLGWALLGVVSVGLILLSWEWFESSASLDLKMTVLNSGIVQKAIEEAGEGLRIPFVIVYGLTQPVLPAAIAEVALPIWKTVVILRALGWYGLVPLLLFGFWRVWKAQPDNERQILVWMSGFIIIWILLSSARGGGDVWDNPRYRTIFLPWMALLAAWAWQWARENRDAWLARLAVAEGIFLLFFTHWYLSRYLRLWRKLPFWQTVAAIIITTILVFGGSWVWDRVREHRRAKQSASGN
jgi:hypothetical protein